MDYTKINSSQISVDVDNNIVLPVKPAPVVSLDDMNTAMTNLQSQLAQVTTTLISAQQMATYGQTRIDAEKQQASDLQAQINALQALIDTATTQGAVTTEVFQAKTDTPVLSDNNPIN